MKFIKKLQIIRFVGHNVDTLKHTSRLFSVTMRQRNRRNWHQNGVWTYKNKWVYFIFLCNLYSKHRAAERWIWLKHHGKYFQTPWKKNETHEAGSQKSTWPLLLTVVTNYTFVFTRFSFISPEQRGWIVSGDKKKLKSVIGSHNIYQYCGHCFMKTGNGFCKSKCNGWDCSGEKLTA